MILRRLIAAVAVLTAIVHVSATTAFAYTQANDVIFLQRDPFATQASLDSDYRLQGMGGLDLPVSDESNKVGTFKYGQAPAGLAQDYRQGKVELGLTSEGGTLKDKETNDTAYTGDIADVGQSSLHGMFAVRTGQTAENHGAFVAGIVAEGDKVDYNGGFKTASGFQKLEDEPRLGQIRIGYGHQLGKLLFGFGIDSVGATAVDQEATTTLGMAANIEATLDLVDVVPSIGYVAPLQQGALTFTLSPRFRSIEDKYKLNSSELKTEQDGTLFDLVAHYGNGAAVQSALYLTLGGVDGDRTINGADAGTTDTEDTDIRFRLNARPSGSAFSFGLLLENLKNTTETDDETGVRIGDDETVDTTFGGGVAYHFTEDKGLVGLELRLLKIDEQDHLSSLGNEKSNGYEMRLGGEHVVGSKLWLRAGFNIKSLDVEPEGKPELNVTTSQLTLGAEYAFTERSSLAFNLSSIGTSSEGSASALEDKQEYGGMSAQLVGKVRFGEPLAD